MPLADPLLVMTGARGMMVITTLAVPVPPAFVAVMVAVAVPAAVGVPMIAPEVELTDRPLGRPLAPKEVGLFVAVMS
jgi:hypothetical protein